MLAELGHARYTFRVAIPLQQLNTWSHQGAITSSAAAYASVQHALTKSSSPLTNKTLKIFLQGSYGNDTNIYGDSDVDVVVLYEDTFHHDPSALSLEQRAVHAQIFPAATYTWHNLRDDVLAALRAHYGTAKVTVGNKSIKVQTGNGRPSDVIPAVQFRKYATFTDRSNLSAHWGIQFFDASNSPVVNYPKYHIDRGVDKNSQARTGGNYKSVVRVFKNLRNWMVDNDVIAKGVAPSYFIECALHNVPDDLFKLSLERAVPAITDHLMQAQYGTLMCQNGVIKLIGTESTQWSSDDFATFVISANSTWDNWR